MKSRIIKIGIFLIIFSSCDLSDGSSIVILPNAKIRKSMKVSELRKIDNVRFSQYEGFIFQDFLVLTDQSYLKIYSDTEIQEIEKDRIVGFRKKINVKDAKLSIIEDSLCNLFQVTKKNIVNPKLTIYSNKIGVVFSLYNDLNFIFLTISNNKECLNPKL
jgi:hypothetical protein